MEYGFFFLLQEKIIDLLEKKHRKNLDLNTNIQNRKDFRNPRWAVGENVDWYWYDLLICEWGLWRSWYGFSSLNNFQCLVMWKRHYYIIICNSVHFFYFTKPLKYINRLNCTCTMLLHVYSHFIFFFWLL